MTKILGKRYSDYTINVISLVTIKEDEFNRLTPDAKAVMLFVKYSDDPDKLEELGKLEEFRKLDRDVLRIINAVTGADIPIKEGLNNMCEGIEILKQRAKQEGIEEATDNTRKDDIKKCFIAMKALKPEADDEEISSLLAKQFNKPVSDIEAICM